MNRRRVAPELDPAAWPAFDTGALPKKQRSSFKARQRAVELYAANTAVAEIERRTGVDRRQLYRLLDHCVAPHDDGRAFGWRALVPYTRVADYHASPRSSSVVTAQAAEPSARSVCCCRRTRRWPHGSPSACAASASRSTRSAPTWVFELDCAVSNTCTPTSCASAGPWASPQPTIPSTPIA